MSAGEGEQQDTAKQFTRMGFDLGPLLVFFAVNYLFGIYAATAAFMVAVTAALAGSRLMLGKVSPMPLVTAGLVLVFGGLTLFLQDETFIKVKPTVLYILFAAVLFAGLLTGRLFLQILLGEALELTSAGWRILTMRWIWFFLFLAGLNELVWRTMSTDFWVGFKVFGLLPLTLVFAVIQVALLTKHHGRQSETG